MNTIGVEILEELLEAQDQGHPIPLKDAVSWWGLGSTWESIVDNGYVYRDPVIGVTVTGAGRRYLTELYERRGFGKKQKPVVHVTFWQKALPIGFILIVAFFALWYLGFWA